MHGHARENGHTVSILSFKFLSYFLYIAISVFRDYKKKKKNIKHQDMLQIIKSSYIQQSLTYQIIFQNFKKLNKDITFYRRKYVLLT